MKPSGAASAVFGLAGRTIWVVSIGGGVGNPPARSETTRGEDQTDQPGDRIYLAEGGVILTLMPGKQAGGKLFAVNGTVRTSGKTQEDCRKIRRGLPVFGISDQS